MKLIFQESGRAGRDGKQAYAFLLANKSDIKKQQELLQLRYPSITEIKESYQQLANYLQIPEKQPTRSNQFLLTLLALVSAIN